MDRDLATFTSNITILHFRQLFMSLTSIIKWMDLSMCIELTESSLADQGLSCLLVDGIDKGQGENVAGATCCSKRHCQQTRLCECSWSVFPVNREIPTSWTQQAVDYNYCLTYSSLGSLLST